MKLNYKMSKSLENKISCAIKDCELVITTQIYNHFRNNTNESDYGFFNIFKKYASLEFVTHPIFLDVFEEYVNITDPIEYGFDILKNLVLLDNKQGIEILLEKYPTIINNQENANIMCYIIAAANYPLYLKFVNEYPELMSRAIDGILPIDFLHSKRCIKSLHHHPSKKSSEKDFVIAQENIFKHHIENFQSSEKSPQQYIIPQKLNHIIHELLMMLLMKFSDDTNMLTSIFYKNIKNYRERKITLEILRAYLDAGMDYTYKSNYIVNRCAGWKLNYLKLFIEYGYVPDAKTIINACRHYNYEVFKYIYDNYNINTSNTVDGKPIIFYATCFSSKQFLEIIDYPNMNVSKSFYKINILHYIFEEDLYSDDRTEIVEKLIEKGINPYEKNRNGSCFFHNYLTYDDVKILQKLGIDLATQDENKENTSVLHILMNDALEDEQYIELANIFFHDYKFSNRDITDLMNNIDYIIDNSIFNTMSWQIRLRHLHALNLPLGNYTMKFFNL